MNKFLLPWKRVPFARFIIPFLIGILLFFTGVKIHYIFSIIPVFLLLTCIAFEKASIFKLFKYRHLLGFTINITLVFSSYFLALTFIHIDKPYHFSKFYQHEAFIVGHLKEMPEMKNKTLKTTIKVEYLIYNNKIIKVTGKILTYFVKSPKSKTLDFGDVIIFKGNINEIPSPLNPSQFNYKRFLAYKRIYHQVYLNDKNWIKTSENHALRIIKGIIKLRGKIINEIQKDVKSSDERAIAIALMAGSKTELSSELRNSFSSTGAMHVLAVSGLHVGIISLVFGFFTRPLKKFRTGKFLFVIINLSLIWAYAVLTGLSPSVLRASAMFSFMIIGTNTNKVPNIYSSLYTSLFVLLLIDPLMVSQVGFQLSYIAVIGIVAFYPRIYNLLHLKKIWPADKIWSLTAVSLSAQLSTFPLTLLYFNMFPLYFLVSNLVVIPAAALIMYSGFAFLTFRLIGFDWLSDIFSYLFNFFLKILNQSILYIQNLPNGKIDEIYLNPAMTFLIYLFIFLLFFYFLFLNRKLLLLSLFCFSFLLIGFTNWKIKNKLIKEVVIYSIPHQSLLGFYSDDKIVFWGDSSILYDNEKLKYNTFRDLWKLGLKAKNIKKISFGQNFSDSTLLIKNNYCLFCNISFVVTDKHVKIQELSDKFKTNYLIIRPETKTYTQNILKIYQPEKIIINGSEKSKRTIKTREIAENYKIEVINLAQNGAIQIKSWSKIDFPGTLQNISLRIKEICKLK